MLNVQAYITKKTERTLLIGVHSPTNHTQNIASYNAEFIKLAETNEVEPTAIIFIKLRAIDPGYFITKGKLEDLKKECEKYDIEKVIFSDPLSPQQERNLNDYLECTVIDRTRLILEIFEKAARSAEGKAQVEIAMFQHQKTRLAGKGIFLEQQFGVKGTRGGPGETVKEKEKRILDDYIAKLKIQLKALQKVRETQRKQRLKSGIPLICLVGYTNSGKSTILNQLTQSNVLAEDKLFATLDTTVRELIIDNKKEALLADTVGFIQQLPPQLIAAFKSTLSELSYANLLLHVIDASDSNWQEHASVVQQILKELNIHAPILYVFNKIDAIKNDNNNQLYSSYLPHTMISALSKKDMVPLIDSIRKWIDDQKK